MNQHFRLGLVNVSNDFRRQQQFVRRIADHDRILRVHLLQAVQVQQYAQPIHHFR